MTPSQTLLKIAILAAGAVGRDLAPPAKSVIKAGTGKTLTTIKNTVKPKPKPNPAPAPAPRPSGPFAMFDAVDVTHIPAGATAVAGYVNGNYRNVGLLVGRFPRARILTISVNVFADAECLDVETGDATPAQAPAWVKRQRARGVKRPCVYANRSTMPAVWKALEASGIGRSQVRLWVADWTGEPHIPASYDACQWHGGMTVPYDESLCLTNFFT